MKKRLTILLGIGGLLILSVGLYWQSKVDHRFSFAVFEPRYEGESLSYWVQNLYSYNQTRHVNGASQAAILYTGTKALPLLLDWVSRPDPRFYRPGQIEYQRHAVEAFEVLGPVAKPAIPQLIKNVSKGSRYSMQALEFIGPDAVPPLADKLVGTLADKRQPVMNWRDSGYKEGFFHVQEIIINGLREMGTNAEAAIPAMTKVIYANHSWHWWGEGNDPYSALVSIGQNHPEVVVPALIDVLTNATSPVFNRGAIAQAMALFGTNHADVFLPVLMISLNDKRTDDWNRRTMAGALAVVGQGKPDLVVPVLLEAFTNSDVKYRDGIADALGAFGSDARRALPLLLDASRNPYFYLREKAAIALKKIDPERADSLSMMIKDVDNREPGFRQQTIYALGKLGTNALEAVPALLKCMSNRDPQTRIDATRALNQIGVASDEFISALGTNLSDTNSFVVQEALSNLAALASHSKLAFVTLIQKGVRGQIGRDERWQARWRLIELSRDDPKFLLECLDNSDATVRSGALIVFYELERSVPQSIPKLKELSKNDPDSDVRSRAADVLRLQLQ
jgi:HEAT repeat protein